MTFAEFFEAVWNRKPFPWQEKLSAKTLEGDWPAIGLPTAAGKTALVDIAVHALAERAPGAARRIFFVVDRRVIVDEAAERAGYLAAKLKEATRGSRLWGIAEALRAQGGDPDPLHVATLRGGIPRDDSWTRSPLQPMVICSTVDQVGSSLLFRAYGGNEYRWPIRAGLAANDSVIILDEAHTSQPFAETLEWIRRYRGWAKQPLGRGFTVVEMSATPRSDEVFREHEDDLTHEVLRKRWRAEKRARLVVEDPQANEEAARGEFGALIDGLVREARVMRDRRGAEVIGVISNRVRMARRVHAQLTKDENCDALLLTGRARPYDRDQIWQKWRSAIGLGRATAPSRPVFVVATQCIEVGANIDFDALVTEIASVDAIEQRFGRLDRNGEAGLSHAVIVAQKDEIKSKYNDPVYGTALAATWKWLEGHVTVEERTETVPVEGRKKPKTNRIKDEFVRMGVLALREALAGTANRDALIMPRNSAPILMPAHMDLLAQTSPEPAISPEPALLLHGPESGPADVQIIWRQDLCDEPDLWASILALCSPAAAEAVSLPVWTVREWLSQRAVSDLADLEGLSSRDESKGGSIKPVLEWRSTDDYQMLRSPGAIRPGMTIVVPASYGGCDEWGWNPESSGIVRDIGDPVKLLMGRPVLRLQGELASTWGYSTLAGHLRASESVAEARAALATPADPEAHEWVRVAIRALASSRKLDLVPFPKTDPAQESSWGAVIGRGTFEQESNQASYTAEVRLDAHLAGCAAWAASFAKELPEPARQTVIQAAALHDIGKADPRFQAWLRGGNPVKPHELIAKSKKSAQNREAMERARQLAGYPKGGRHELLSVALLQHLADAFPELDFELLLHLVGSHHGRCRPFAPVVEDHDPRSLTYNGWRAHLAHGLESAGSEVAERYWRLTRKYGWYGLAYLETLVRLADQRQSESEQERAEPAQEDGAHA